MIGKIVLTMLVAEGVDVCGRCCVIEEFPLCGGGSTYRINERGAARPQAARLHVTVCILRGRFYYSLPLRARGRSSCPIKAFMAQG